MLSILYICSTSINLAIICDQVILPKEIILFDFCLINWPWPYGPPIAKFKILITRLAQGLPIGGELDLLDYNTMSTAFTSRSEIKKIS